MRFQPLKRAGVSAPERSRKGPFAFQTGFMSGGLCSVNSDRGEKCYWWERI